MTKNCPPDKIYEQNCKQPNCDGSYSKIDSILNNFSNKSSLLYSDFPYQCKPLTTCMKNGINELPDIEKTKYSITGKTHNGNEIMDYSTVKYTFDNQCPLKNN